MPLHDKYHFSFEKSCSVINAILWTNLIIYDSFFLYRPLGYCFIMSDEYAGKVMRVAVAKVCESLDIGTTHKSCFDMLFNLAINRT